MRRTQSGFTLIELLIVITIITALMALLLPNLMQGHDAANAIGDKLNLERHFQWMVVYKSKHGGALPPEGGIRFVMSTWTSGTVEHTQENLERYFTPGPARDNDLAFQDYKKQVSRGEDPWPTLNDVDRTSTHYCGRAKKWARDRESGSEEAWMANDNDTLWSLRDGTIHVLLSGGNVREYNYDVLRQELGLPPFDKNKPIVTWGENSPIEVCRKLDDS
ncbi:MAG: type II secretion system protein [Planctomycetes bacterium]|nr:type II secretion system protein [Planctomycetota bacterium]